jgi:hypothetical protein
VHTCHTILLPLPRPPTCTHRPHHPHHPQRNTTTTRVHRNARASHTQPQRNLHPPTTPRTSAHRATPAPCCSSALPHVPSHVVVCFVKRPTGCQRLRPPPASDSSPVAASPSSSIVHEPTPSVPPLPPSSPVAVVVTVTSPQAPSLANRGPRPFHRSPSVEVVRQLCFRRGEGVPEPSTSGNRSSLTSPYSRQRPRVSPHNRTITLTKLSLANCTSVTSVSSLRHSPSLRELDISVHGGDGSGHEGLDEIGTLQCLRAGGRTQLDASTLRRCRSLREVDLSGSDVTDAVLAALADVSTLETLKLSLSCCLEVRDVSALARSVSLRNWTSGLRRVRHRHCGVGAHPIPHLALTRFV